MYTLVLTMATTLTGTMFKILQETRLGLSLKDLRDKMSSLDPIRFSRESDNQRGWKNSMRSTLSIQQVFVKKRSGWFHIDHIDSDSDSDSGDYGPGQEQEPMEIVYPPEYLKNLEEYM